MKLKDLQKHYNKLQLEYGSPDLDSIYNGGCEDNPDICFVFMNPTGRNIASKKSWHGLKSPWIGTKNIWDLFYALDLVDEKIYQTTLEHYAACVKEALRDVPLTRTILDRRVCCRSLC